MKKVKLLKKYIDDFTDNGRAEPPQLWDDDETVQLRGVEYLKKFKKEDWYYLQSNWRYNEYHWITCLIDLLDAINSVESRKLMVEIGLSGDDEETLDAMECIREFIENIDEKIKKELKEKTGRIIRDRMKNV